MKDFKLPPNPIITGLPAQRTLTKPTSIPQSGPSFKEILGQAVTETQQKQLTLSKHAQIRAEQRSIELTQDDMERIGQAVDKAQEKGITDTLVFMNNTAFIVNVPNKVVVTIVDGQETQENVFTNINGAVII
jgi:flagellar operon protein